MKWSNKRQRFESSGKNLVYYPLTNTSWSYSWYRISHTINGLVLLNTFPYSRTTTRHMYKVRRRLHITSTPYVKVHAPNGIPTEDIGLIITYMKGEIKRLQEKNEHKRARGDAKRWREWNINWMQDSVNKMVSTIINNEVDHMLAS